MSDFGPFLSWFPSAVEVLSAALHPLQQGLLQADTLGSYLPPRAREAGRALPIQPKHNASMKQRRKVTSSTCTAGLAS